MANSHVLIQSQTLSSAIASVTFGSGGTLPQTYRDLYLVISGQTTGALNNIQVQLNSDTASNYTNLRILGDGTNASSASSGSITFLQWGDMGTLDTVVTGSLLDYSTSDRHKNSIVRGNNSASGGVVSTYAGRWANTAAVTSFKLSAGAGNFAVGCSFYLYGVLG